jgi:hypothetical protein
MFSLGLLSFTADSDQISGDHLARLGNVESLAIKGPKLLVSLDPLSSFSSLRHLSIDCKVFELNNAILPVNLVTLVLTSTVCDKIPFFDFSRFSRLEELRFVGDMLRGKVSRVSLPASLRTLFVHAECLVEFKSMEKYDGD